MEFASEMIVKAIYHQLNISEVPIRYFRRSGNSKLLPLSDAWRHIKFLILYTPTYAFIIPGLVFLVIDPYIGIQLVMLGVFAKVYTNKQLNLPSGPLARFLISHLTVERLFIAGVILLLVPEFRLIGVQLIFTSFFYGLLKES